MFDPSVINKLERDFHLISQSKKLDNGHGLDDRKNIYKRFNSNTLCFKTISASGVHL